MDYWTEFNKTLEKLDEDAKKMDTKSALEYVNKEVTTKLLPELKKWDLEANKYTEERDKQNEDIQKLANHTTTILRNELEKLNFTTSVKLMSSLTAKTNLIGESDIDIAILVKNLDEDKLFQIIKKLEGQGYRFDYIFNANKIDNKYYSFIKTVDGIPIEVKVRDLDFSLPIVQLHDYLDSKLTNEERRIITFAKYKLKELSKILRNHIIYMRFKKIIYEGYFYYIPNNFRINMG
jgi:hypothetical protein